MNKRDLDKWTPAICEKQRTFADMVDAQCEGKEVQCKDSQDECDDAWHDAGDLLKISRPERYVGRCRSVAANRVDTMSEVPVADLRRGLDTRLTRLVQHPSQMAMILPVTDEAIATARQLIAVMPAWLCYCDDIVPLEDGGVQFEFTELPLYVEIEIDAVGFISWLVVFGRDRDIRERAFYGDSTHADPTSIVYHISSYANKGLTS